MIWCISVMSRDGLTLVAHHRAEDTKEVQAICTVARSEDMSTRIWIKPPAGCVYGWDDPTAADLRELSARD